MKRTFNTKRTKVRGKFPYIVRSTDDLTKDIYLFEVTHKTSLRQIITIEGAFADQEIIFATVDPNFTNSLSTIDASNIYEVGDRGRRDFYFYEDGMFYETRIKICPHFPKLRLVKTDRINQKLRMTC